MHILHLNVNSLLPKIAEICFIAKQPNASIIGISESRLDSSILNSEADVIGCDIIRMDRSRRGGGVPCHMKKPLSYNHESNFCPNIESIFIDIFLPKSKPILVDVLHWPPDKPRFIKYLDNSLKESNISNIQKEYLTSDFNIDLLYGNKMLPDKQYYEFYSQAPPLIKKYMEFCFSHSLHQLIAEETRTTERTKTRIDHILTL